MIIGPGTRLGRYEIITHLASGGMATVYVARAIGAAGFQRLVAIKRLHAHIAGDAQFVEMFLDEARLAARIRHPNVVPTLDLDNGDDGLYLAMEFVEGDSLLGLLKNSAKRGEPIPASIALRIMIDTLHGLDAAHDLKDDRGQPLNPVHRDVSPHNILVGTDGVARITDFGVARAEERVTSTRDGQIKGKLSYMAPETTTGEGFDRRADLFSAAIVLWETLTSRRLFKGANDLEVLRQLSLAPIPHIRDIDPTLPRSLDAVVAKGLQRDPAARYATAAEFADELESAGEAVGIAGPRAVSAFVKTMSAERIDELAATVRAWTEGEGKRRLVVIEGAAAPAVEADAQDTAIRDTGPNRSAPALTNTSVVPAPQPRSARRAMVIAVVAAGLVVLGALIASVTLSVVGPAPQSAAATIAATTPPTPAAIAPSVAPTVDAPVTNISDLPRSDTATRPVVGRTPRVAPMPSEAPIAPSNTVTAIATSAPIATTPPPPPTVPSTTKPAPSSTSFNPEAM